MLTTVKILVVDDEPDLEPLIRQGFRRKIRSGEYTFVFAGDGLEALEALDQDPEIDLVLTDINMPRMDGLKLLANLNDLDRVLKAVVVTAYGDMENIRTAMNQGAFDFLTKPLVLDDLKKTVEKASQAIVQQKKADLARQTFGRYLSDEVVATLLDQPEALKLGGEKRKVTLLMSDLRGFSIISERRPPETVVEILNIYLGRMADVITDYHGTIDEFIGDAILVIFGAPILREDDALRAVACAIDMQRAMAGVNAQLAERGLPKLEMGIGINTGEVVVGNIGSLKRAKYGVVGSHVNLTARIESYTVGGQVLTTESTLMEAGPAVLIGKQMKLSAKGFAEPLSIYEIEGVGAPYDLSLPLWVEHMVTLDHAWPFAFSVLDGKHMTGAGCEGTMIQLSTSGAVIHTDEPVALLSNLKMMLPAPEDGDEVVGDLYAKVVEDVPGEGVVKVRFTAVPEEVAEAIEHVCAAEKEES
ncbi:MAG: response regulator [Bacteroidetes bacterium]|nr:response regulator [Bacteroidota bacterium]